MPRSHVPRTNSEAQLDEDTAAAEFRDLCMFYRVVNGIRDRQASNSMGISDQPESENVETQKSYGNSTTAQHNYQQNQPLDAVTPYQSSNEASPHTYTYFEGYLAQPSFPAVEPNSIVAEADDWSISGYDDQDTRTHQHNDVPIVEADDDTGEDGVFNIEL